MSRPVEGDIVATSTMAQLLRRRFSRDSNHLSQEEVDGLLVDSEGRSFMVVHHLLSLRELGIPILLPGTPVTCKVESTERYTTRSKVRVCTLYTVRLTHGKFNWTVKRKYKHFQELHRDIYKHKMMLHFLPLGRFALQRQQLRNMTEEMPSLHGGDRMRRHSSKPKFLEDHLNGLLANSFCRNFRSMLEFLDVGLLSFVSDLGPKGLEGWIFKRSGGHRTQGLNCIGHHQFCFRWSRRWLVVKDSFLLYLNRENGVICFVLLFDPEFKVQVGRAYTDTEYGVCIENFSRRLVIKCNSYRQALWWSHEIDRLAEPCDFLKVQRFDGFAPPRDDTLTKWYVNGSGYFADLADALEQAKEEIFITDWWLSPEVFLKRPAKNTYWRLDEILKRKAEQGVKVCVLLYKEVELALGINSGHSKRTLMNMHPNIKVMRHPNHVSAVVFLWAHHEKMVAIDQSVAFVGGIDLAFGRWDDSQYRLLDLASMETKKGAESEAVDEVDQVDQDQGDQEQGDQEKGDQDQGDQEKGDQDQGDQEKGDQDQQDQDQGDQEKGDQNQADQEKGDQEKGDQNQADQEKGDQEKGDQEKGDQEKGDQGPPGAEGSMVQTQEDLTDNTQLWLGKDYSNFIRRDWVQLDKPFEDNIDRTQIPRMPWRDLSAAVHGQAARDVARHFIQRWNFTKIYKYNYKDRFYPCLLPKSHSTADSLPFTVPGSERARVQVLRSVDRWSAGTCESSILNAYIHTIQTSEHYIYIENQFFISCADGKNVHNGIGDAIVERILRAHREQKTYRVFVVVPLLPGFEGDIKEGGGNAIQAILHFTYRTMCRGEFSILSRLREVQDQWSDYISLCGLRTHSELSQCPITELIYIHSKMLIADDRRYIIGSANINDRSMLGSRDSELAVLVEDEERVPSIMDGQEYQAGPLALALRKDCFRILTGADSDPSINIDDPVSDYFFYLVWNQAAKMNGSIYHKVFNCLPCNSVHNMRELREFSCQERLCDTDPEEAKQEMKKIRGLLVHFPLNFLSEENLLPPLGSKEGMAPVGLWT